MTIHASTHVDHGNARIAALIIRVVREVALEPVGLSILVWIANPRDDRRVSAGDRCADLTPELKRRRHTPKRPIGLKRLGWPGRRSTRAPE